MNRLNRSHPHPLRQPILTAALATATLLCLSLTVSAFERYSQNDNATLCRECHGDFRSNNYISLTDGMNWGNLHNLHRSVLVSGDCEACHLSSDEFPVILDRSAGGTGLDPISCMGCHGRAEDNVEGNPEVADGRSGYGAGLRQHHFTTGVTECTECHLDADPSSYDTVGEEVLPPYFANPGSEHPNIPTDPCNTEGSENVAGLPEGLDNDGDDVYDDSDTDCGVSGVEEESLLADFRVANYPNPFVATTAIEFDVPEAASVDVRILDVNGRQVRYVEVGDAVSGFQRVQWDGRDEVGSEVSSGLYLYEVRIGEKRSQQTMVLLR